MTLRHADTGWDHYADAWRVGCGINFLRDPDNLIAFSCEYRRSDEAHAGGRSFGARFASLSEFHFVINPRIALESRWPTAVQRLRSWAGRVRAPPALGKI